MERNIALSITALTLLAIGIAILLPGRTVDPDPKVPWKIETNADGSSSVLGLTLGHSTLEEVQNQFQEAPELTLFVGKDGSMSLEAYFERIFISGLRADMVMNLSLPEREIQDMYDRGVRMSKLGSGEKKVTLSPADENAAGRSVIQHFTYLPMADLEPDLIQARFGEPAERIATEDGIVHWLYPEVGLDIAVDARRKEVFQYVQPKDFDRLVVEPLKNAELATNSSTGS